MNKRELIEHISSTLDKYLKNTTFVKPVLTITEIAKSDEVSLEFEVNKNCILLDDNRQELNKPVIPQFVADWIEECKNDDFHLFGAMEEMSLHQKKLDYWFREDDNMELFARAWLDGYTVEEEKLYLVKIKGVACPYLNYDTINELWFYNQKIEGAYTKTKHTRKELEQAGFGWVFDCEGIEIEEVE